MLHIQDGHNLNDSMWPTNMLAVVAIFVTIGIDETSFKDLTLVFEKLREVSRYFRHFSATTYYLYKPITL